MPVKPAGSLLKIEEHKEKAIKILKSCAASGDKYVTRNVFARRLNLHPEYATEVLRTLKAEGKVDYSHYLGWSLVDEEHCKS